MGNREDLERAWSIMEDMRICVLIDVDAGLLRARPMSAIPERERDAIWFFTDVRAHKDDEIMADARVCLSFQSPEEGIFLSVTGRGSIISDEELIRAYWNDEADVWFPDGPTSKDIRLLRVVPEFGEYWIRPFDIDAVGRELARARAEDDRPDLGENAKVTFSAVAH